ncbi:MAG: hypothetical protein KF718_11850 [Polyangiaceae bacterium]|nr:hypothetical protein [Polyangiaceae bacterium]
MTRVPPQPADSSTAPSPAERTPLPVARLPEGDPRVVAAWREWLGALATDAEAALAASMAYKELDPPGREQWLTALEQDASELGIPRIAVYAPLLAVETDAGRRARITEALGPADVRATPRRAPRGLSGRAPSGEHVAAVVWPLYLDFVQVLACGYRTSAGFSWVRHDPIVQDGAAPKPGDQVLGVALEAVPLRGLVDELALAVLAHQRSGRALPEVLALFADLFDPAPA